MVNIVYSYGSIGTEVMKKSGENVQQLSEEQTRRLTELKEHYEYGDYGVIATLTNKSRDYVRKVLSPTDYRWNDQIVETYTNIIKGRLEEKVRLAESAKLFLLNN